MSERIPRVAVVSGGSSGIGLACVKRLLAIGHRVAFFSQQAERVRAVARELGARHPGRVHADVADLRDPLAISGFFADVARIWEPAGILVNVAGVSPKRPGGRSRIAEIPAAEWEDVLRVNLTGAFHCCQAVLPSMTERRFGRIVFIGSVAGRTLPRIAGASYVASKSALVGFARSVVSEASAFGVTANTICPGRIVTDMTGPAGSPANQDALQRIPIGRLGTPDDVARVVETLVAEDADFINGAVIDVNGGEFLAP
ncbi:MAG: 3-oxoacyl-ACP reductase FabG [Alphaproteobacteria bacterium]|nr:3-oxoacyl-ACP reductase FabG [Alphaproteobacteria bacterium]